MDIYTDIAFYGTILGAPLIFGVIGITKELIYWRYRKRYEARWHKPTRTPNT